MNIIYELPPVGEARNIQLLESPQSCISRSALPSHVSIYLHPLTLPPAKVYLALWVRPSYWWAWLSRAAPYWAHGFEGHLLSPYGSTWLNGGHSLRMSSHGGEGPLPRIWAWFTRGHFPLYGCAWFSEATSPSMGAHGWDWPLAPYGGTWFRGATSPVWVHMVQRSH